MGDHFSRNLVHSVRTTLFVLTLSRDETADSTDCARYDDFMSRFQTLLIVFLLLRPAVCTAQSSIAEIPKLIRDLGAESRAERMAAENALIQLGEPALPELQRHFPNDPGTRLIVRRISQRIRDIASEDVLKDHPLQFNNPAPVLLATFAERLSAQSGNPIVCEPAVNSLQMTTDDQPRLFWEWVDLCAKTAPCSWKLGRDGLTFGEFRGRQAEHVGYSKCLRLVARQEPLRVTQRLPDSRLIRIEMQASVEPRITPYFLQVDDSDFSLIAGETTCQVFNPAAHRELQFLGTRTISWTVDFLAPQDFQNTTVNLHGQVTMFCAARERRFEFPLKIGVSAPDKKAIVQNVQNVAGQLHVTMIILLPEQASEFESYRQAALHRRTWLETNSGNRIHPTAIEILRAAATDHLVRFTFPIPPDNGQANLIYQFPELLTYLPVEFEINEIDLPATE